MSQRYPRGLASALTLELPADLTPAQASAILSLLTDLRERLFDHYLAQVQEYLKNEIVTREPPPDEPLRDPPF